MNKEQILSDLERDPIATLKALDEVQREAEKVRATHKIESAFITFDTLVAELRGLHRPQPLPEWVADDIGYMVESLQEIIANVKDERADELREGF